MQTHLENWSSVYRITTSILLREVWGWVIDLRIISRDMSRIQMPEGRAQSSWPSPKDWQVFSFVLNCWWHGKVVVKTRLIYSRHWLKTTFFFSRHCSKTKVFGLGHFITNNLFIGLGHKVIGLGKKRWPAYSPPENSTPVVFPLNIPPQRSLALRNMPLTRTCSH